LFFEITRQLELGLIVPSRCAQMEDHLMISWRSLEVYTLSGCFLWSGGLL